MEWFSTEEYEATVSVVCGKKEAIKLRVQNGPRGKLAEKNNPVSLQFGSVENARVFILRLLGRIMELGRQKGEY